MRNKNGKHLYFLTENHPNPLDADYVAFAPERFDSDEEAAKFYADWYKINTNGVVVRVVAVPNKDNSNYVVQS